MTDVSDAVNAGVSTYAKAEAALETAHDALLKLPPVYKALYASKKIGFLESQERATAANSLAGQVAAALNAVIVRHQNDTARAQVLGIDLPAPAGGVHTDGGGR